MDLLALVPSHTFVSGTATEYVDVFATAGACEEIYRALCAKGVEVLYDDLDKGAGAKFATADLIGVPWQVMVGPRGLAEGKVEVKKRADGSKELMSPAAALDLLSR